MARPSRGRPKGTDAPRDPASTRAALVIAHPGHELRVHGWMERHKPIVFVMTDGSGSGGVSRLASTERVLRAAGARLGEIFGHFTDRELYERIRCGDVAVFGRLAERLAAIFRRDGVGVVAGDAVEGYNPGHDVTRLVLNGAVQSASRGGPALLNYEFPLHGPPAGRASEARLPRLRVRLDDAALGRKLQAAQGYPELREEVEQTLARHGEEAFRDEWLLPVTYGMAIAERVGAKPFYEQFGAERVANGLYDEVIRFRQHVEPLANGLCARLAGAVTA